MASFTMTMPNAINFLGGEIGTAEDGSFILSGSDVGLSHYPIFDESYRERLNSLIVSTFYNREIAHETPLIWRLRMRTKMRTIMPYFNELYLSTKIDYDPLSTVDIKTDSTHNATTLGEALVKALGKTESFSGARTINSEFPQLMLAGNEDYATAGSDNTSTGGAESDTENTTTSKGDEQSIDASTTKGYQGVASALIMAYRDSLINVDEMVLNELEPLFFRLMSTRESRTTEESMYTGAYGYPFRY